MSIVAVVAMVVRGFVDFARIAAVTALVEVAGLIVIVSESKDTYQPCVGGSGKASRLW